MPERRCLSRTGSSPLIGEPFVLRAYRMNSGKRRFSTSIMHDRWKSAYKRNEVAEAGDLKLSTHGGRGNTPTSGSGSGAAMDVQTRLCFFVDKNEDLADFCPRFGRDHCEVQFVYRL
ncbi:protein of unknown function [Kyrpidia spormannii]|uniref:Uncharacterized protein n=2 Tax=Kyrpidia spormannii TaxID=2055160 RepID=A0ACA8Z967_9BACL|nr:protein of unknown function [Kyrpidia spormannii]CAB3393172.1 protein of unknown function [Kyrpidia spormannii]